MNSHNHPMMGSVDSWFYKYLGGIRNDPGAAGFKRIIIQPHLVDGLNWVRTSYNSPYGLIRSEWRKEKESLVLKISVPVNTSAMVYAPSSWGGSITEGGRPVSITRRDGDTRLIELGSGDYELVLK